MTSSPPTRTLRMAFRSRDAERGVGFVIDEPRCAPRVLRLGCGETLLGSAPACTLSLRGRYVSRRHAIVSVAGARVTLRDLGSRNGTLVDGRPVRETELSPGALLVLGDVTATRLETRGAGFLFEELVAGGPASLSLYHRLNRVAASTTATLLVGPSGVGKELLARAIHRRSARASGPFVVVNCGALPPTLAEAELFGARRGAYTGAVQDREGLLAKADGGTVFLDEVGELPESVQPKLLRVLESGELHPLGGRRRTRIDVRVVAATNRPIDDAIQCPGFRRDLLYRLSGYRLHVPPLAERREDIVPIAASLVQRLGEGRRLTPEALEWLHARPWPGNVRELRNMLSAATALSRSHEIDVSTLREVLGAREGPGEPGAALGAVALGPLDRILVRTIREHGGSRAAALRALDMPRSTFYARLRRLREAGVSL